MGNLQFAVAIISVGQTAGFTELGPLEAECFVCATEFGRVLSLPPRRGPGFHLESTARWICVTTKDILGKPELLEFIAATQRFEHIPNSIVSAPDGLLGENPIRVAKTAMLNRAQRRIPLKSQAGIEVARFV